MKYNENCLFTFSNSLLVLIHRENFSKAALTELIYTWSYHYHIVFVSTENKIKVTISETSIMSLMFIKKRVDQG